jgi:hypothetical protein
MLDAKVTLCLEKKKKEKNSDRNPNKKPHVTWDLRCSGALRTFACLLVTNFSGQPVGPIFKGQVVQLVTDFSKQPIRTINAA